jgi:hypothetical protein
MEDSAEKLGVGRQGIPHRKTLVLPNWQACLGTAAAAYDLLLNGMALMITWW